MPFLSASSVAFARFDSENAAIDELVTANIFRQVSDLLEVASDTGANIYELIQNHFSHHQGALELIQAAFDNTLI